MYKCFITNSILMGSFIIVLLGWYFCFTAILHKSPFVGSTGRSAAVVRRKVAEAGALVGRICESLDEWYMKQLPFLGGNEPPIFRRFGFLDV